MKTTPKILLGLLFVVGIAAGYAFSGSMAKSEILAIGASAPQADLKMTDVSGKSLNLNEIKKEKGLLVIFSCNTCPFVVGNGSKSEGWEGRYPGLAEAAEKNNIGFVLVNSNEAKRDAGDNLDDMKKHYREKGYKGYYVLDKNHVLADAFGALTTPHVFLFDKDMKLVYKGAIDDAVDSPSAVKEAWLTNAIRAMAAGKAIEPNSTRQMGCSIKRVKA